MRSRLIDAISSFVSELSAQRADVLVVATTRPQGYRGEFGDALPCEQLELLEFTEGEALSYSEALTAVRTSEDPDLAAQVTERSLATALLLPTGYAAFYAVAEARVLDYRYTAFPQFTGWLASVGETPLYGYLSLDERLIYYARRDIPIVNDEALQRLRARGSQHGA